MADSTVAEARARWPATPPRSRARRSRSRASGSRRSAARSRRALYVPVGAAEPGPLLVYFHGGGFVVGDLDTHDNLCRFLARQSGVRVLCGRLPAGARASVSGPVRRRARGVPLRRRARRRARRRPRADRGRRRQRRREPRGRRRARSRPPGGGRAPAFQLLFYPWLDLVIRAPLLRAVRRGLLPDPRGPALVPETITSPTRRRRVTRVARRWPPSDLGAGPPAYVVTAGFDPLRDEGEDYARRLREAGTRVALRRHRA